MRTSKWLACALALSATAASAQVKTYSIAFKSPSGLPANVDQIVAKAGGTIVLRLPQIGGVGATSSSPTFAADVAKDPSVSLAAEAVKISVPRPPQDADAAPANDRNNGGNFSPAGPDPQPMPDPFGFQQWDKMRLNATVTGSYALQRGRRDVVVAVLDTGIDFTHQEWTVGSNLDAARSISFVPDEPTPQDFNGHGTWCASAVGAPINGIGISGVAPNVTLVAEKVLAASGSGEFLFVDAALVYAGENHFDVASMSLGGFIPKCHADRPGCDPEPDYILLQRAVQFARQNGVLPVAALGNDGLDVSDGAVFRSFIEAPGEVAGVVGVSATGFFNQKAFYSNYGTGKTDVSAPGGSTRNYTGVPGSGAPPPPYFGIGRVLGAYSNTASEPLPANPDVDACFSVPGRDPLPQPCRGYAWLQGTSMATPHVSGVAALIVSQYGDFAPNNKNKPHMSPTQVETILQITANNQPCPTPSTVVQGPGEALLTATCQGASGGQSPDPAAAGAGYTNFFGKGIVDAVKAVTR